jgi:nucleoside-diphosphate-sugar epimerase
VYYLLPAHNPFIVFFRKDCTMQTILILGVRGRLGHAAAQAGWEVIGHSRKIDPAMPSVRWIDTDLSDIDALTRAATGACAVLHAVNPLYTQWSTQAQLLLDQSIALAKRLQATLLFPGNVYNFGSPMPAKIAPDTPQQPSSKKGQLRCQMEASLVRAADEGVRSITLRAGDFFGGSVRGAWFDLALVKEIAKGTMRYPGARNVPHAWAYLPDLARAFVGLAAQGAALPPRSMFHFAGHTLCGDDWTRALTPIARQANWLAPDAALKVGGLPWGLFRLGAPFVPMWRELAEMRYLWEEPHALADPSLAAHIGPQLVTPLSAALPQALRDLGFSIPSI